MYALENRESEVCKREKQEIIGKYKKMTHIRRKIFMIVLGALLFKQRIYKLLGTVRAAFVIPPAAREKLPTIQLYKIANSTERKDFLVIGLRIIEKRRRRAVVKAIIRAAILIIWALCFA